MSMNVDKMYWTALKSDGTKERVEASLVVEHKLDVYVNGEKAVSLVCSNDQLEELVTGRLCTDGYISRKEDISKISFDASCERAEVALSADNDAADRRALEKVKTCDYNPEDVFEIAGRFAEGMPVHSMTKGTHSCILARGREMLYSCEDIGRHNTVDKAVGYALINGIDLTKCILYISGRVPTDMMQKVIRAGIPVLVSKAVPTADAVKMADEYGVTLIVKAYPDKIEICR